MVRMTDPSPGSWRRRRRGGKYRQSPAPRENRPWSADAARRNRDAAFGMPKRPWIETPQSPQSPQSAPSAQSLPSAQSSQSPLSPSSSQAGPAVPGHPGQRHGRRAARPREWVAGPHDDTTEIDAWSAPAPAPGPATPGPDDASGGSGAGDGGRHPGDDPSVNRGGPQKRPLHRRAAPAPEGSLPIVAFWTVATSFVPGTGLLTTSLRRIGWALLAVLAVAVIALTGWLVFGDPLRSGIKLVTNRSVLVGVMLGTTLVAVVWAIQIILANLAQSTKERLEGTKRYIALAIAAVMVIGVALPFGRGIQSLWAAQGLLGSDTVFGTEDTIDMDPGEDPWAGVGRMNILLLGQDAGEDRTGTRPDTIMVASVDTASGRTALFSIPRNLEHVRFPEGTPAAEVFPDGFRYFGGQQDLINAVWTWAEDRPDLFPNDPEPGLTATTWAVEETLGLEMDYYAMVNLRGFEDLVNAIGGVDLVVERRIPIGGGAAAVEGYIEPGEQHLDGFHALWYARSREGSDDFNRMCRQQRIVRAVSEEADPTTVALSIPGLVSATEKNIQSNIPVSRLDAFAELALRIKDSGFTSYPITQEVTPSHNADWDYLKAWTEASLEDSMQRAEPESVLGETEPGSTAPAATGDAPPPGDGTGEGAAEEPGSGSAEPTEPTEEPATTEPDSPTDEADPEEPTQETADEPTEEPEIDQDPLQSCLPGADED